MAGRFPPPTDADVRGPLVKALKQAGWDVARAIDELPEGSLDRPHFERAVASGRVLVSNDDDHRSLANRWFREARPFPGLIAWSQEDYAQMTYGEIVDAFEKLAQQDDPFSPYPIVRIKPRR